MLAADNYYYFPEPTYYRYPENTDNIFESYVDNPDLFKENQIPDDFIILRHYDLKKDLESITRQGQSEATRHKFYYYKGMIDRLSDLIITAKKVWQYNLVMDYNDLANRLAKLRPVIKMANEDLNVYYYFKGQSDILKQLILNAPIQVKT